MPSYSKNNIIIGGAALLGVTAGGLYYLWSLNKKEDVP